MVNGGLILDEENNLLSIKGVRSIMGKIFSRKTKSDRVLFRLGDFSHAQMGSPSLPDVIGFW